MKFRADIIKTVQNICKIEVRTDEAFAKRNNPYILKGLLIGTIVGLVVSIFRLILDHTLDGLLVLYPYLRKHWAYIAPYVLLTIAIWWILVKVAKPLMTNPKISWWSGLWRTFIGALLALCPGICAGREGPCISMGVYIAQGLSEKVYHADENDRPIFLHSGMAAGLAAAFSAPIAGPLFLLEAVSFDFAPIILITSLTTSLAATIVTYCFFGTAPALKFPATPAIPLKYYSLLVVLGIIIGVLARGFQASTLLTQKYYDHFAIPSEYNIIVPLLLTIPVGLFYPKILGGSHILIKQMVQPQTITKIANSPLSLLILLVILAVVRFTMTMVSCEAEAPTGIFMPILSLGAIYGALLGVIAIRLRIMPPQYYVHVVACTMSAYFGATLCSPFTAIILLVEVAGSVQYVMPILLVTWVAYLVMKWLRGSTVYDG